MNKTDLINVVAQEAELTKKDAEAAVNATIAAIANALKSGDKVQLIGFGTFEVKAVAEREGRNPKTGETIKIAAAKKPAFTASKVLKDQVNA
ncbi:MAG: HU family DNA-binding protein [Clostridia bacterium]|nr:HU family DNA-binding protein [Clostridia bacterium]